MPSDYGLCCMGDDCIMPCKKVTFYHHCISCGGFLHVPCGVTDVDDRTTCNRCVRSSSQHPAFGNKSPKKAVLQFVARQAASDGEAEEAAARLQAQSPEAAATLQVGLLEAAATSEGEAEEAAAALQHRRRQQQRCK
jgi:hypothetical protein